MEQYSRYMPEKPLRGVSFPNMGMMIYVFCSLKYHLFYLKCPQTGRNNQTLLYLTLNKTP